MAEWQDMIGPCPGKWAYFHDLSYTPRLGQLAYHKAADYHRFLGFFSYPRGGKSLAAAREVGSTWARPDYHCWIVAPKYELGAKEFGYIWEDHATKRRGRTRLFDLATRHVFNIQGGDMDLTYPWGWFCRVRTADNPADLLGEELDELILAEGAQIAQSIWTRYLLARIARRKGRVHVPTTPKGRNWMYDTWYAPGQKLLEGKPNPLRDRAYWSTTVSHLKEHGDIYQPGVYAEDEIERARREMPAPIFLEQFAGQFVSYAGLVFQAINRGTHRCPRLIPPSEWDLVVAIDPGTSPDPCAVLFIAWDLQTPRHAWLWAEMYERDKSIEYVAKGIHRILGGRRPLAFVCDPAEKQYRLELHQHTIPTVAPHSKNFQDGWQAVTALAQTGRLHAADHLEHWWYEVERFEWKESGAGEIRSGKKTSVLASDTSGPDHLMAAMRYGLLFPVSGVEGEVPDPVGPPLRADLSPSDRRVWESWRGVQRQIMEETGTAPGSAEADVFVDDEMEEIFR